MRPGEQAGARSGAAPDPEAEQERRREARDRRGQPFGEDGDAEHAVRRRDDPERQDRLVQEVLAAVQRNEVVAVGDHERRRRRVHRLVAPLQRRAVETSEVQVQGEGDAREGERRRQRPHPVRRRVRPARDRNARRAHSGRSNSRRRRSPSAPRAGGNVMRGSRCPDADRRRDERDAPRLDHALQGAGGLGPQRLERTAHGPGRDARRAAARHPGLARVAREDGRELALERGAVLDPRVVGGVARRRPLGAPDEGGQALELAVGADAEDERPRRRPRSPVRERSAGARCRAGRASSPVSSADCATLMSEASVAEKRFVSTWLPAPVRSRAASAARTPMAV